MRFKVDESYKIRHKILEVLFNDQEKTSTSDKRVGSIEINKLTGFPIDKIHRYHELLKKEEEIDCSEQDGQHRMYILENGRYSYLEKKYKIGGRNDLWDYWFQPLKVIIPTIAVIVSVFAIIANHAANKRINQLVEQVQELEKLHMVHK